MRFADVIAPVTTDDFIHRYLGHEMLLTPEAPGRFAHLLPWEDLNEALNRMRVGGYRLRLQQNGRALDRSTYLADPDNDAGSPIRGAEFERLLAAGATLVLDGVDELFPAIRRLVEEFEQIFRVRTRVNLYAGWRTQQGLDLHFDHHDTLILQVHGRKQWKVYRPTRLHPLSTDIEVAERPTDEAVWDGVLEGGRMLYLPRGWWHVACPLDGPSLHLTFGLAHATGAQMLEWFVSELKAFVETRMDVPHLNTPEVRHAWIAAVRDRILSAWTDDVLDRFMAGEDRLAIARPDVHLPDNAAGRIVLTPEARLRLAIGRKLQFADAGDETVTFLVADHRWTCAAELVPALARLNHLRGQSIAELCAAVREAVVPELKLFLGVLAMSAVLSVEPVPRAPAGTASDFPA